MYYYFVDQLGSTRAVTQANGTVCFSADYYPYGQELNYNTTCLQNYKFTGYERDTETGLDYAFNRYYNPRLGRFMSADPLAGSIADPQSLNRYTYVRNDPGNLIDPLGLYLVCVHGELYDRVDFFVDGLSAGSDFTLIGPCDDKHRGGDLGGGGDRGGGNSSPSPTWAAIKTFFTPPSTGPGSCTAVFLNSIQNSGGNALRTTATNLQKYGQTAASGLANAGPQAEETIAAMVAGGQLSPAVGAVATNIVTGIAPLAAAAAPYVVKVGGYAVLAGLDVLLFKGVADELSAALKGQCKP